MATTEFLSPNAHFVTERGPADINGVRTALEFWKWSYSDLMQNTTRGIVAQYIVAWALGIDDKPHDPWRSYDLMSADGKKIEVKSTAFLQAWNYGSEGRNPLFVLEPKLEWSKENGLAKEPTWNAEIFVLCYFHWRQIETANIMNLDQWKFWVFRKDELIKALNGRRSLTVNFLETNGYKSVSAFELKDTVLNIDRIKPPILESKSQAKDRSRRLDEKTFFEIAVKKLEKEQLNGLWQIYNYCSKTAEIVWGTTSFGAVFPKTLDRSLFSIYSNGEIQLYYGFLNEGKKSLFVKELSGIKEIKAILSDKKGSPMCKDTDWLKSATNFISSLEKLSYL